MSNYQPVGDGHVHTCVFMLIMVLVCIVYDIFAYMYWGQGGASTISRALTYEIRQKPILACVLGMLLVHWVKWD